MFATPKWLRDTPRSLVSQATDAKVLAPLLLATALFLLTYIATRIIRRSKEARQQQRQRAGGLNVLLTNGRFPVSIDLARQLKRAGHAVYVVDPMHYHICRFSVAVRKSYFVPAPTADAAGYVAGVKHAIKEANIDLVIPLHEEGYYLARSGEEEIARRLLAPDFKTLLELHNKWEFYHVLGRAGLDRPRTWLCKSMDDVRAVVEVSGLELAVKPTFGRAKSGFHHHIPGVPLPEDLDVGEENHYVTQEWVDGQAFCSYALIRYGKIQAFGVYPVEETIDGSSCVYCEVRRHAAETPT